jgi:hypothetical protein
MAIKSSFLLVKTAQVRPLPDTIVPSIMRSAANAIGSKKRHFVPVEAAVSLESTREKRRSL